MYSWSWSWRPWAVRYQLLGCSCSGKCKVSSTTDILTAEEERIKILEECCCSFISSVFSLSSAIFQEADVWGPSPFTYISYFIISLPEKDAGNSLLGSLWTYTLRSSPSFVMLVMADLFLGNFLGRSSFLALQRDDLIVWSLLGL